MNTSQHSNDHTISSTPLILFKTDRFPPKLLHSLVDEMKDMKFICSETRSVKHALKLVLMNLCFSLNHAGEEKWVSLYRSKKHFGECSVNRALGLNYNALKTVLDFLLDRGYIREKKGFNKYMIKKSNPRYKLKNDGQNGRKTKASSTKIIGTDRLRIKVNLYFSGFEFSISEDHPLIYRKISKVGEWNNKFSVLEVVPYAVAQKHGLTMLRKYQKMLFETPVAINNQCLSDTDKLFRRQMWGKGCMFDGRLQGEKYKQVTRSDRDTILINGNQTIEIDIKSTYPTIAYALQGHDITLLLKERWDAYVPKEFHNDQFEWDEIRAFCKPILMYILNGKDQPSAANTCWIISRKA